MAQFRKRPVIIEAFRYGIDERPDWFTHGVTIKEVFTFPDHCLICTLEGNMRGEVGDYIIKGVKGEFYPCKEDIFNSTYEIVGPTIEEIDAALAEHNLHEEWLESESSINALKELLVKSLNDKRDEE